MAQALMRFNLMPPMWRNEDGSERAAVPDEEDAPPALERHRAAQWLRQSKLGPALDLQEPALPLALLPETLWQPLTLLLGAALNAPHLRRTIARAEREWLLQQLGTEALAVARTPFAQALADLPATPHWRAADALALCLNGGAAVLSQAFEQSAAEVAQRARLRMDPAAEALRQTLAAAGLTPGRALDVSRALLHELEPSWLSSFPPTH